MAHSPLVMTNVTKRFGAFTAVDSLSLDVPEGAIIGFLGPNGAGKSTSLRMALGVIPADAGEVRLFGETPNILALRRVGFLPERPYFYQHLTAREFLHFYGQLFDIPRDVRSRRVESLLERVHLHRFGDVPLRNFSKGMLQRAGLAQALINDPELVVMDEPMSGLDPMGRALVRDGRRVRGRTHERPLGLRWARKCSG